MRVLICGRITTSSFSIPVGNSAGKEGYPHRLYSMAWHCPRMKSFRNHREIIDLLRSGQRHRGLPSVAFSPVMTVGGTNREDQTNRELAK